MKYRSCNDHADCELRLGAFKKTVTIPNGRRSIRNFMLMNSNALALDLVGVGIPYDIPLFSDRSMALF